MTKKKKKTLQEKIQKELDKLEALHEKEEDVIEAINEILEEDCGCGCKDCACKS